MLEDSKEYQKHLGGSVEGHPTYFKVTIGLYSCAWLDGFRCVTVGGETSDDWDNPYAEESANEVWAYSAWKAGALAGESYNKSLLTEMRAAEKWKSR